MKLPTERDFGWDLKSLDSAYTEVNTLPGGQTELIIDHDTVEGVTTEMLLWWFERFPRLTVTKDGEDYPAYQLWHPSDHIGVEAIPDEQLRQGHQLVIAEAFQRNPDHRIQQKAEVFYLDTDGIGLQFRKFGHSVMRLRHRFEDSQEGVRYHSRMVVGADQGLLKPLINRVVVPRKFGPERANAWLQHNVEEVGCFEHFLPELYDERHQGECIAL